MVIDQITHCTLVGHVRLMMMSGSNHLSCWPAQCAVTKPKPTDENLRPSQAGAVVDLARP